VAYAIALAYTAHAVLIVRAPTSAPITFLLVEWSSLFLPNVGGVVVDQLVFRFLISRSVSEMFAIEVQSSP